MVAFDIVLYLIFYASIMYFQDVSAKVDPKTVNLELETSLLFDPKHETNHSIADIKHFIIRLQNLLNPIKAMLEPNKNKISDVIETIARRVNDFNDKDFEKLSRVLIKEVDERINNNNQLSTLLGDKYNTVVKYIHENPNMLRAHTRKSGNKNFKAIKVLITKLDKYYDESDIEKLNKIVNKLENLPKSNDELKKLVKNALDVVLFDKYKNLNNTIKSQLFNELLTIQRYLKIKMHKDKTVSDTEASNVSSENEANISIENRNYITNETNDGEIILNKNIEILIENDDLKSD